MIKSPEEKIAEYYKIKPTQFSALKSLTISQGLGASGWMEQSLSLVIARDFENQEECLYLDFFGVKGLEIKQPQTSHIVLSLVEILPGKDLPEIHETYLVRDPEQTRVLWFECRDFQATVG